MMASDREKEVATTYERGDSRTVAYRLSKTLILFLSWFCLGLFNEVVGPTLPDLKARIGANYEEIARVLAARSAGLFIGSVLGGLLHDSIPRRRDLLLTIALLISGTTITVAPHLGTLWIMGIVFHLMGQGHALQTTGGNPALQILWLDQSSGPFNFLHAGFGLGAAVAPLIARPFLTGLTDDDMIHGNGTDLELNDTLTDHLEYQGQYQDNVSYSHDENRTHAMVVPGELSPIEYPYSIVGALCFFTAACFLTFFLFSKRAPKQFQPQNPKTVRIICDPRTCAGEDKSFGLKLFILVFLYYAGVVGAARSYGKFVYSFVRDSEDLQFSKSEAAWLNTLFWIAFTISRLLMSVVAKWLPIHVIQFVLVIGLSSSAIALYLCRASHTGFWIVTFFFGFCHAPLFPCGLGWLNRYLHITSMLIMLVNIGSASGGMLSQWFTGYCFEYYGPTSFLYIIIALSLFITVNFCLMHLIGYIHGDRFARNSKVGSEEQSTMTGLKSDTHEEEDAL